MKAKGNDLEFISRIKRDGSGTVVEDFTHMENEVFHITCLSLTEKTFIASGFNSFVVKIKDLESVKQKNKSEY